MSITIQGPELAFIAEHYGELATQALEAVVTCGLLGRLLEARHTCGATVPPKIHSPGTLSSHQNPRSVSLGLAHPDEPSPGATPLWPRLYQRQANLIYLGASDWEKRTCHCSWLYGLPPGLRGALCQRIDVINTLAAAKNAGRLKQNSKNTPKPALLILDELGYSPLTNRGPISSSKSSAYAMTNSDHDYLKRAFKEWPKMFNNDSTLTAAILDRLAAPRRDRRHRRQKLSHERPNRAVSRPGLGVVGIDDWRCRRCLSRLLGPRIFQTNGFHTFSRSR